MRVECTQCDHEFSVSEERAGTTVRCPSCKEPTKVRGGKSVNGKTSGRDDREGITDRKKSGAVPAGRVAKRTQLARAHDDDDDHDGEEDDRPVGKAKSRRDEDDDDDRRARKKTSLRDDDDDDDRPSKSKKRKNGKQKSGSPMVWILAGVGGVALLGVVVLVIVLATPSKEKQVKNAEQALNELAKQMEKEMAKQNPELAKQMQKDLTELAKNPPTMPVPNKGPNPLVPPFNPPGPTKKQSLVEARKGFMTNLARRESGGKPLPEPPAQLFSKVKYDSPVGKLSAYLTPNPKDGKKHAAIIWITGGDCNSADENVWQEGPPDNDQSASVFRKAGMIMMFPTLRGGNDNPGVREGFFGEVDDVLAAAEFLAKQEYVDAKRIYLGGHSTGGTLVLLCAECSDRFRAVFSFGPVTLAQNYPSEFTPWNKGIKKENELRSPGLWLHAIKGKVFVFEGTIQGNLLDLQGLEVIAKQEASQARPEFFAVKGATHFSILKPTTELIAIRILQDDGPTCNIVFNATELERMVARPGPNRSPNPNPSPGPVPVGPVTKPIGPGPNPNPVPDPTTAIMQGTIVLKAEGNLTVNDPDDPKRPGSHYRKHMLMLTAGKSYAIELQKIPNSTVDPYLRLHDENFNVLAEDDNSGGNQQARIIYKATPQACCIWAVATSAQPNQFGGVRLLVTELDGPAANAPVNPNPNPNPNPIQPVNPVVPNPPVNPGNGNVVFDKKFHFTKTVLAENATVKMEAGKTYILEMTGSPTSAGDPVIAVNTYPQVANGSNKHARLSFAPQQTGNFLVNLTFTGNAPPRGQFHFTVTQATK